MGEVLAAREAYQQAQKDARKLIERARLDLGRRIYEARKQGIPQGDIARDLGIKREQVRRFESEYREKAGLSDSEKS